MHGGLASLSQELAPANPWSTKRRVSSVRQKGLCAHVHPTRPSSCAGYAPSDMPVKAKRSTYNYSLPITVKKMRKCLCAPCGPRLICPHRDAEEGGHLDSGVRWGFLRGRSRAPLASVPERGRGETYPYIPKYCYCPLAASPLVTMHDLKQGLGPSGMASTRKSTSNKYKLKVGAPGPQRRAATHPIEGAVDRGEEAPPSCRPGAHTLPESPVWATGKGSDRLLCRPVPLCDSQLPGWPWEAQ